MRRLFATIILSIACLGAQAKTRVIFLNGINNGQSDQIGSEDKLKDVIGSYWASDRISSGKLSVGHWDNPANGLLEDVVELTAQAQLSYDALQCAKVFDSAAVIGDKYYKECLGNLYRTRSASPTITPAQARVYLTTIRFSLTLFNSLQSTNDDFIIVAHSQGNYVAEAADAYLRVVNPSLADSINRRVRFVGVASVASSTPNRRYISLAEDVALSRHQDTLSFSLLPLPILSRTHSVCGSGDVCLTTLRVADLSMHGFREIYLSDYSYLLPSPIKKYVSDMVRDSYFELHPEENPNWRINPANGHAYEVITCGKWTDCRDVAISRGARLVTIRSQSENEWIFANFLAQSHTEWGMWIGLNNYITLGDWAWSSNDYAPYRNWYPGQPSGGSEHFVHMYKNVSQWNDRTDDANNEIDQAIIEYGSWSDLILPRGTQWDAVADFSLQRNPSGPWQYGYQAGTSLFQPMGGTGTNCADLGMPCWKMNANSVDLPMVAINNTGATVTRRTVVVPNGVLVLHPGINLERALVTWTVPDSGTYAFSGAFQLVDVRPTNGVNVSVAVGESPVLETSIVQWQSQQPFNFTRTLAKEGLINAAATGPDH